MQCLGGNGYINGDAPSMTLAQSMPTDRASEFPTGRFLRDARLYAVGAGTQEIRRMLIGREINNVFLS